MDWIENSTLHPVITQNLYRVKNGRFEQIGMSWLKHGFSVAWSNTCNTCTEPGSSFLGVGCSDLYSASLNGSQSRLGPRSQVNATTGAFAWPKANLPSTGTLDGRLRVLTNDLNPSLNTGARYFVESQYIHPQDAAAGNGNNNASYREVFVGTVTGGWTVQTNSSAQIVRMQPAINAWKAVHSDVKLYAVDVPNDGRIIVGVRTTPLTGGGYHTEFAVENLNSHQSVRSLAVQHGSSDITNPGFRDVSYQHEPYSGTDWAPNVIGDEIEWSTETFATNANANALRWGTVYSFWCDSELPPRKLTLGMFRPGTVSEMSVDLVTPILPESHTLKNAQVISGQFSNTFLSDNQYYTLGPVIAKRLPGIEMFLESTAPNNSPTDFGFRLEASMTGVPFGQVVQTVQLLNHQTGNYEEIDFRAIETTDRSIDITPAGNFSNFIHPTTRRINARIEWAYVEPNGREPYSWRVLIDEAIWFFGQ